MQFWLLQLPFETSCSVMLQNLVVWQLRILPISSSLSEADSKELCLGPTACVLLLLCSLLSLVIGMPGIMNDTCPLARFVPEVSDEVMNNKSEKINK